jgi:serine/threonine protein kinase
MPQVETQTGICSTCGALTDTSLFGDELTCMACLLRLGFAATKRRDDDGSLGAAVPDHIGPYVVARRDDGRAWVLGHGAMGITFRAIDESLQRPVALKIINANLGSRSAEARERFTREARAAGALRHPNVATVYQFGVSEETGQFFYAMELVEGETLEERVRRLGPLDVLTTIDVALQVTAALEAAEERGLVHRDLKPGNLMLVSPGDAAVGASTQRGDYSHHERGVVATALRRRAGRNAIGADRGGEKLVVKVIDFGVAKAISEKTNAMAITHDRFVGTPAFASPEQFINAPVDVRSDIYSLGATLWFLLTGHMIFSERSVLEIRNAHFSTPLPIEQLKAARVPRRLISLLKLMLAVEPAARPAGARQLAAKLQAIHAQITNRRKIAQRYAIAAAVVALATIVGVRLFHSTTPSTNTPVIPEKSIAVLPFENFSDDKENAYFADGVQDEILTDLTKVADLKVISRRSVAQYRDPKQSIREIGQALRVAHVLEGTVRKVSGRIHVTTQLIDTRTEAETWAEKYDRDVADIFLIQSDISQEVVSRLKAALSPEEKAAIEEKPTQDKEAYDFYLRARALVYEQYDLRGSTLQDSARKAIPLLESAIARDPKFALAYCVLGDAHLQLEDPVKAKEAIDTALRISPNSAEAHLILARYFIHEIEDVAGGEKELSIAAAGLPGRVEVFNLRAEVEEKNGQWKEALRDREKAAELDPRDVTTTDDLGLLYLTLRWYSNAERLVDHSIAITPEQSADYDYFWREKSLIALAKGDTKVAMSALDANPFRNLGVWGLNHLIARVFVLERDYGKAEEILQSVDEIAHARNLLPRSADPGFDLYVRGVTLEKLGRIARFRGDKEKARGYFGAAREKFEGWLANNPGHHSWHESHSQAYIAEIDAALGRKDDAIREGRKAVELWPLKRDAGLASDVAAYLAIVYVWSGERDAALQQLAEVVRLPATPGLMPVSPGLSAGELKLDPLWDELRNDPRFDKIVAEAAKPVKLD